MSIFGGERSLPLGFRSLQITAVWTTDSRGAKWWEMEEEADIYLPSSK